MGWNGDGKTRTLKTFWFWAMLLGDILGFGERSCWKDWTLPKNVVACFRITALTSSLFRKFSQMTGKAGSNASSCAKYSVIDCDKYAIDDFLQINVHLSAALRSFTSSMILIGGAFPRNLKTTPGKTGSCIFSKFKASEVTFSKIS